MSVKATTRVQELLGLDFDSGIAVLDSLPISFKQIADQVFGGEDPSAFFFLSAPS